MRTSPLDSISTEHVNGSPAGVSNSRFAAGLILGALAGAAVALLFAPSSGDKLRRQLGKGAGKIADRAREMYSTAYSRAGEVASRARETVERETVG
jgi:gas vesicle protein